MNLRLVKAKRCDWSAKRVPANQVETCANRDVFTHFSRA